MSKAIDELFDRLESVGVKTIVIAPGGRNAPIGKALRDSPTRFQVWRHFEERSAAFFALGRSKSTSEPVAVVTTSGTAAAETLPAVMEAFYSRVPLIVITADRPDRFRGSGAPQAAEQVGLFGIYAATVVDIQQDDEIAPFRVESSPIHINIGFEEPLKDGSAGPNPKKDTFNRPLFESVSNFLKCATRPLVIVGQLSPHEHAIVRDFLVESGAACYCEPLSGLREAEALRSQRLRIGDGLLDRATEIGLRFDGVLRIGGVPTHRLWRDLESKFAEIPVLSVGTRPFTGLGRPSELLVGDLESLLKSAPSTQREDMDKLYTSDLQLGFELEALLQKLPMAEPSLFRSLSEVLSKNANIFLGNSMPIREWDLAAAARDNGFELSASRGLNGIDGQVSAFLGACKENRENVAIIGDLTALYDVAGFWPMNDHPELRATVVIINNRGGRIFRRMFDEQEFQNVHDLSMKAIADLWGLSYLLVEKPEGFPQAGLPGGIIEVRPDLDQTDQFWREWTAAIH